MITEEPLTTEENLPENKVKQYRERGFVAIQGIISKERAARYREAALELAARRRSSFDRKVFTQLVNAWRESEPLKELTLDPNVASVAETLAGGPLRLWHDQVLIKNPKNSAPTEFHQDQPYWPHANSVRPISAWVALCDVPVERGCMTFIPGSQQRTGLAAQDLTDAGSLMSLSPDLRWEERITVPLKAGDCTFHHGRTAHMATPNFTDDPRVAHVVIFIDAGTTYRKKPHVVTDSLDLEDGAPLDGELFPRVPVRPE